jgi:hypothetical protein
MVGVRVASSPLTRFFFFCRAIDTFDCVQGTMRSTAQRTGTERVEFNALAVLFLVLFVVLYLL